MDKTQHRDLLTKAYNIKQRFLAMYKMANAGHVGCSLSVAEIITFVRFGWMKDSDELILSKGHAAAALYSMLAEDGTLTEEDIQTFYKNGTYLAAHPPVNKLKRVPFATGSLGHGLSLAAGLGIANKLKKTDKQIFCITSDGEINEGSTWEAALFIAHHKLTNVVWLIDRNQLQGYGRTEDVMKLDPLDKKLEAFGFNVVIADGHDFNSLETCRLSTVNCQLPTVIVCNTTKGHGWKTYEDKVDCHYLPMKDEQYALVTAEVRNSFEKQMALVK
ncbi:MAG: transketolase [Chitinophagales bacterium]|nr:transketolase [Chitinophagales bacterium]